MTRKKSSSQKLLWTIIVLLFAGVIYYLAEKEEIKNPSPVTPVAVVTQEVKGTTTTAPYYLYPLGNSDGSWYEVYFTNPQTPFSGNYTDGIAKYLIQKIDLSQKSIDVAVYDFNIGDVTQALINAKKRGVDVRVVYDDDYADAQEIAKLKQAGISVVPDERKAFMHNKFFVFDDACIWTGSFNISENAANKNNENALYFCSPEVSENYGSEFDEMFINREFGPTSPSDTPYPVFTVDGITIENYFASEDDVMAKVIREVATAHTSVHFMVFSFTDDDLSKAMITDAERGVSIEGVFETVGADTEYSECGTLLRKGYDIRLDGNPYTFHHKVIIIDDQIVILGSFNFTGNANTNNDENLLIVHDHALAEAYEQQYQLMKSQAVVPPGTTCKK